MNILNFIELVFEQERDKMSSSALDKVEDCKNAIAAFIDGREVDLQEAILSDFIYDFGVFMTEKYDKHYSPSTAKECLRTLRKYIRIAISRGLVPNIDSVPFVIAELDDKVWGESEKEKQQTAKPLEVGTASCINSLMRNLDVWHTKQRMGTLKIQDRKERNEALQIKCVAIYLFCLKNYGLSIKDAISIKREAEKSDTDDDNKNDQSRNLTITVNGEKLLLSASASKFLDIYNGDALPGEYLFSTLDNKKYKNDADNAAALIEGHITKYFKRKGLPLYKGMSVYVDYLNYAIENGLDMADAGKLWKLHLGKGDTADSKDLVLTVHDLCNGSKDVIAEKWYLLNVFSPSVKRNGFLKMLLASGIIGSEKEAKKRIYAPEERSQDRKQGQSAVLSRYIFFRATPMQAQFVNLFSPYAYVLKEKMRNQFVQIKQREIEELQVTLRDFPEAVELIDSKKWLEKHNGKIIPGRKAIIRSGSLAGKEATVVRIKGKNTESETYILEYVEGQIKFQTDLVGVELDMVES